MKVSYWAYILAFLGLFGIILINLFGNLTTSSEQDYHLLKEITEAAMIDAVDLNAVREGIGYDGVTDLTHPEYMHCVEYSNSNPRIIRDRFVESFVRRFAETAKTTDKYEIIFHDIDECPPKVSVTVVTHESLGFLKRLFGNKTKDAEGNELTYDSTTAVVNKLTAILETKAESKE